MVHLLIRSAAVRAAVAVSFEDFAPFVNGEGRGQAELASGKKSIRNTQFFGVLFAVFALIGAANRAVRFAVDTIGDALFRAVRLVVGAPFKRVGGVVGAQLGKYLRAVLGVVGGVVGSFPLRVLVRHENTVSFRLAKLQHEASRLEAATRMILDGWVRHKGGLSCAWN